MTKEELKQIKLAIKSLSTSTNITIVYDSIIFKIKEDNIHIKNADSKYPYSGIYMQNSEYAIILNTTSLPLLSPILNFESIHKYRTFWKMFDIPNYITSPLNCWLNLLDIPIPNNKLQGIAVAFPNIKHENDRQVFEFPIENEEFFTREFVTIQNWKTIHNLIYPTQKIIDTSDINNNKKAIEISVFNNNEYTIIIKDNKTNEIDTIYFNTLVEEIEHLIEPKNCYTLTAIRNLINEE